MSHVNEYKLFQGKKKPRERFNLKPPSDETPYYDVNYDKSPKQDPDEPFFSVNKNKYFTDKYTDVIKQQRELNSNIGITKWKEFGFTSEDIEKLKTLGSISNPYYNKDEDFWVCHVSLHNSEYAISFKYYLPEKDFIVSSPDFVDCKKSHKKRFTNAGDAVNWVMEVRNSIKARTREMGRRVTESNEPGLDVFGMKGIDKKLNNLIEFDDFDKTLKSKQQKATKRTEVGLDILNEGLSVNKITLDVPLFIRMLEYAKEDAKTDMDLHKVTENILDMSSDGKMLTMANYDSIVKIK